MYNVFFYIKDLNAVNDTEIFESNLRDIYLEQLKLHWGNGINAESSIQNEGICTFCPVGYFLGLRALAHFELYQVFVCEIVLNVFLIYILRQNVSKVR